MIKLMLMCVQFFPFVTSKTYEQIEGKVISVIDGNTFELIASDGETYKILLYGIDCPEIGQPFADVAKTQLEKILLKEKVVVEIQGKDRWGNRLGVPLLKRIDPRHELLKAGLAWTAERNPIEELEIIRDEALKSQKGIWRESDPTPPWIYRRQQSMLQVKSSW